MPRRAQEKWTPLLQLRYFRERGTWRAAKGYDEVDAQTLAISKLSRQKWVMQNIKSLAFREDDDEIYDGIETIRRVYPERVFDSESSE